MEQEDINQKKEASKSDESLDLKVKKKPKKNEEDIKEKSDKSSRLKAEEQTYKGGWEFKAKQRSWGEMRRSNSKKR